MSDFKAKMHQNRFRLRPRPRWGAYSAPPGPLSGFKGPYFQRKGGEEGGKAGEEGSWRGRRGGESKGGKEGREGTPVCIFKFSLE